jgi:hypothetical protein
MFTLSVARSGLSRSSEPCEESRFVPPKRRRTVLKFTAVVLVGWTIIVLGVVIRGRMGAAPHVPDLPQRFLPGNPLPGEAACTRYSNELILRCVVHLADYDVVFSLDAGMSFIHSTLIPAQKYTAGDLVAAWGAPTGITWDETNIYLYWETRSALLDTGSLQPDSRVDYILYELAAPLPAAPWPGFTSVKR